MTIEIPLSKYGKHRGKYIAIVDDDYSHFVDFNWCVHIRPDGRGEYARHMVNGKLISMHRIILEDFLGYSLPKTIHIDHADGNGLNNQIVNLRIATPSQNGANRGLNKNSTSGVKGVTFHKRDQKWQAQIKVNGKNKYLGAFDTLEKAQEAYWSAAQEYFQHFSNKGV